MRHIGSINEKSHAEKFLAYLTSREINAVVEHEDDTYEIWVKEEDQLDAASDFFDQFIEDPDDPIYVEAIQTAREMRAQKQRKLEQARKNVVSMNNQWNRPTIQKAPLTIGFVIVCIVVFFVSGMGQPSSMDNNAYRALVFMSIPWEEGNAIASEYGVKSNELVMANIAKGEVWRLVTPIFIHLGLAHIVFNMIWLFSLGQQVEAKFGKWKYIAVILLIAIASNVLQVVVPETWGGSVPGVVPESKNWLLGGGGMSGVVYGLFGIVLIRSFLDPNGGFMISPFNIVIMLGWMFICMLPNSHEFLGFHVANWAHGVGLIVGLQIGYWTLWWKFKTRRPPVKSPQNKSGSIDETDQDRDSEK